MRRRVPGKQGDDMTEPEWLTCRDAGLLLIQPYARGRPLTRKLRLFACACCRHIGPLLTDERSRQAVELAERFADGQATEEQRAAAERAAVEADRDAQATGPQYAARAAAYAAAAEDAFHDPDDAPEDTEPPEAPHG